MRVIIAGDPPPLPRLLGATGRGTAMRPSDVTDVLSLPRSQEMLDRDICRLAYVAIDGTPRVVPVGFHCNGTQVVVCTPTNAPKLRHLRANPAVALTIDTEVHPPLILLIRGRAELDLVDPIPDEHMQAIKTYAMTPEQRVPWEAEVRSLYLQMVRIVITPTWARMIDFENAAAAHRGAHRAASRAVGSLALSAAGRRVADPSRAGPGSRASERRILRWCRWRW